MERPWSVCRKSIRSFCGGAAACVDYWGQRRPVTSCRLSNQKPPKAGRRWRVHRKNLWELAPERHRCDPDRDRAVPREQKEKREAFIEHLASAIGNLVERYADAHTLAAFQKVTFLSGDLDQVVTGQVQRRSQSDASLLELGGELLNRGRVDIRNDPGETGNAGIPRRPGMLVLYDENGTAYYVWVDNRGQLRISSSEAGADNQEGAIVGIQTRLRRRHIRRIRRLR